jgi:hypothetical protein
VDEKIGATLEVAGKRVNQGFQAVLQIGAH